jgi:hypothetical protein
MYCGSKPSGVFLACAAALLSAPLAAGAQDETDDTSDEEFLSGETGGVEAEDPAAEEQPADEGADEDADAEHDRDHYFQGFVNVTFGTGFFLVAPYNKNDEDEACSELEMGDSGEMEGDAVCTGRSTLHLDILGGFAPLSGFEVFVMTRLGLESPTRARDQSRWIGAGIKKYTPEEGLFKIGIGVAPLFAFSSTNVDVSYDFVLHVPIVFHFDFVKWFGAYLQLAPNISFATEFRLDISGGIGVQGRFP